MKRQSREGGFSFVGRMDQIKQIHQDIQEICQGESRICLIKGEAGVGKTRLLKEIESLAEAKGLQVYKGRCCEGLNLPYLPFMESLFRRLEADFHDPEMLYADDLAMIRLLRRGHSIPSLSMSEQANLDKLRLFLAVSRVLVNLAQQSPTLLMVDDLHWADPLSLDLFAYLAFALAAQKSVPLLIIGTHRPVEPEHQLARLVNRFERESLYRSWTLAGLNEAELRAFLKNLGLSHPSQQLIDIIHDVTRGLPLFIDEVVNHFMQRKTLRECSGYLVAPRISIEMVQLPKEIQSYFYTYIKDMSKIDQKILAIASVLGDDFSLKCLEIASNFRVELLLDALEEGLHRGLLIEEEDGFRFARASIRQAFYQRLSAIRRRHIHLKIAQTLEPVDVANIAYHLVEAGQMAESSQLIHYARQAGHQAFSSFAWCDAARYYEAALDAAEASEMAPQDRAELHYLAGLSHHRNTDIGPVLDHYAKAIDLYRASGCMRGLAQTLVEQTVTSFALPSIPPGTLANLRPLQATLRALGDDEPKLRGRIATVMSQVYSTARQPEAARRMAEYALEIGRGLRDDALCAEACTSLSVAQYHQMDVQEALKSLQSALHHANRTTDLILQSRPLGRLPLSLTLLGQLGAAEEAALHSAELTIKARDRGEHSLALSHLVAIAVAKGDFEVAKQRAHETMTMVDCSLYPWSGVRALPALACTHALLGEVAEAEQALDMLVEPGRASPASDAVSQGATNVFRLLPRMYADLPFEASVGCMAEHVLSHASSDPDFLAPLCALIEIGDYTNTTALMDTPYQQLSQAFQDGVLLTSGWMFLLPRLLGIVEARHQRWDRSSSFFLKAIESATRIGAKPELARTYLDYARMLTAQDALCYYHQAIEYMGNALTIFYELNMQPFINSTTSLIEKVQTRRTLIASLDLTEKGHLSTSEASLLQNAIQEYSSFLR